MSLCILNVGEGDTRISFDKDNPEELERSRRIVTDMLRLGYAIIVQVGQKNGKPIYRRAKKFNSERNEYIIEDVPPVPVTSPAIGIARSAGGMSTAANSIEIKNKLEPFDRCAVARNQLRVIAERAGEWAGLPLPIEGIDLVMEPRYPHAPIYQSQPETPDPDAGCVIRNRFYSLLKRGEVLIWQDETGKIDWGVNAKLHHFDYDFLTMTASCAWGLEQEAKAWQLLAELVSHQQLKSYLLTGMFVEQSLRSGVFYFFRKLKPTVAASGADGENVKILAVLCQHAIAYYQGTWAGAMCPTDDVIAALCLMRGDEKMFWKRCNQHRPFQPEAGL